MKIVLFWKLNFQSKWVIFLHSSGEKRIHKFSKDWLKTVVRSLKSTLSQELRGNLSDESPTIIAKIYNPKKSYYKKRRPVFGARF